MFQFRRFPAYTYFIQCTLLKYCFSGFPHSEIHGSMDICSSPWLIAACHVLHRLLMPRHSPCALSSLTLRTIFFQIWFSVELCRQSQRVLTNCIFYPSPFGVVPQLNICFLSNFRLKDLSVALLITLIPLFSFQGAIFPTSLRSEISSQFLKSLFPSLNHSDLVGPSGLEPPTLRLSVVRSSQLSYGPRLLVEIVGIEPATSCLQGRRSPS